MGLGLNQQQGNVRGHGIDPLGAELRLQLVAIRQQLVGHALVEDLAAVVFGSLVTQLVQSITAAKQKHHGQRQKQRQ